MTEKTPITVYEYAACTTCKRAKRWLDDHDLPYRTVPIVEKPPSASELKKLVRESGLSARKWFNTSGQSYRALVAKRGKNAVDTLSDSEIVDLLSKDGKLIKRPVLLAKDKVLVGFREEQYGELI